MPSDGLELLAVAHYGMARVLLAQGNTPEARQEGQRSLALFTTINHKRAITVAAWLNMLQS